MEENKELDEGKKCLIRKKIAEIQKNVHEFMEQIKNCLRSADSQLYSEYSIKIDYFEIHVPHYS